ncbi:MAG: IS630 family transposase [Gemmatimonadota bacterium]
MAPKDARSLSAEAQQALRRRAVRAVRAGKSQLEVAELFGVTRQAVGRWMKSYREAGSAGLAARRQGRPPGATRLEPWQAAQIARAIKDRTPEQLKLPFYLWTREAVAELIERRFGVRLSVWTVGRYLQRWGFTPQKPLRRAFEQDPVAVQRWLDEEYPAIRAAARRQGARIYWADEMGLRSDHAAGRSYGRRGHTPVIPGIGQRFGCNMISAITNRGRLYFRVFKDPFRAPLFIDFLTRLVRQAPHKVFLIVDRHPVHRAKKVQRWLARHSHQIQLFYLPSYSPELNPDEILNQDVKSNAVGRRRTRDQDQLLRHVRG